MDEALFRRCDEAGVGAALLKTPPTPTREDVAGIETSWRYYRMDPKAFTQTGVLKVDFFEEFVRAGFDVLASDLDVTWVRDPMPWVTGQAAGMQLLAHADVLVSTDIANLALDTARSERWRYAEVNTGVLFLRNTNGTRALLAAWKRKMLDELTAGRLRKDSWGFNDQTYFNMIVRALGLQGVQSQGVWRQWLAERGLADGEVDASREGDRSVYRSRSALPLPSGGSAHITLTALPALEFSGGHIYFVQHEQLARATPPVALHTTYQFSDTPAYTWGKRQRLREAGLWRGDGDEYFDAARSGGFLRLVGPLVEPGSLEGVKVREGVAAVRIEGTNGYTDRLMNNVVDPTALPEDNPMRHLTFDVLQRAALRDALALARATGRTLLLPPLTCWCDRYWNALQRCRMAEAPREMRLPFACPMDHLFDVHLWEEQEVPVRAASFLYHPQANATLRGARVRLRVAGGAEAAEAAQAPLAPGDPIPPLPPPREERTVAAGTRLSDIRAALGAARGAPVLEVGAADLRRLCVDLGSPQANREFDHVMQALLGPAEMVRFNYRHMDSVWGFRPPAPIGERPDCSRASNAVQRLDEASKFVTHFYPFAIKPDTAFETRLQ